MNMLVWNVRGMTDLLKQKLIASLIYSIHVNIVCLIETRVKQNNMQSILDK